MLDAFHDTAILACVLVDGLVSSFMHKKRIITTSRCVHDAEMLQEVNILVQSLHFKGTFVVGKH